MVYFSWYYVIGLIAIILCVILTKRYDDEYLDFVEKEGASAVLCMMIAVFIASFIWPYIFCNTIYDTIRSRKKKGPE